jgi:choline kinase
VNAGVCSAIILAAGLGMRLKELGRQMPKGFLRLGKLPIVEESLRRLQAVGISRVQIVTGHLAEFYEELAARSGGLVSTTYNARYADSGSMYSLYLARNQMDDEAFLLLESDLIYEQRALTTILERPEDDVLLVSGPTGSGDEVYVETDGQKLVNMSKERAALGRSVLGELVGISRITPPLYRAMNAVAEYRFRNSLRLEYEQALVGAAAGRAINCHLISDLAWSEIDNAQDLERAVTRVYPRIVERDGVIEN